MGGQWQDTDPDIDEIFIYKVYDVDCSVFKSLNPSIHYVCIGEFGFFSWAEPELRDNDTDGRVDEDPRNGVDDEDDGLVDEDPSEAPWPDLFRLTGVDRFSTRHPSTNLAHVIAVGYWYVRKTAGRTFSRLPSQPGMCTINPERIRPKTNPTHDQTTVDGRDPSAFRWVKGNELGNGVNINDHSDVPTPPEHDCVMWDDDDPDSNRQNQDPMPDGYGTANPGCALLWYLRL